MGFYHYLSLSFDNYLNNGKEKNEGMQVPKSEPAAKIHLS
jgi:hypothetical protein